VTTAAIRDGLVKRQGWWWPGEDVRIRELLESNEKEGTLLADTYNEEFWQRVREELYRFGYRNDAVALDVGAHVGLWSHRLARSAWFTRVIAFEPERRMAAAWRLNLRNWAGVAELYEFAVGEVPGTVSLKHGGSSFKTHVSCASLPPGHPHSVRQVTLDEFAPAHAQRVAFLKIDTEGYDGFVLRGARELIGRDRPVILFEAKTGIAEKRYGHDTLEPVRELEARDYRIALADNGNYLAVPR
jgi:FkbM family methyltransferase